MENYYEILKVNRDAPESEIRTAFKKLAIQYHPDKIRNKSEEEQAEAHQMMTLINEAYRTLIDEEKKQDYDVWLSARRRAVNPKAPAPTPQRRKQPEYAGTFAEEKPEDVREKEEKKREQIAEKIGSLILNRVLDVPWTSTKIAGWERAYEGGKGMRKFKVGIQAYPEVTGAVVEDLRDLMVAGKGGFGGLLGPTAFFVVVFHDIINHAPVYELFDRVNRDKTRRYLALVNLRYKRIDPPQVAIKNPVIDQICNCLWVGLD